MKAKTTLILFGGVLAVGAYILLVERRAETTDQRKQMARRALRVEPATVTRLSIVSDDLQVVCEKAGADWRLASPVDARADAGAVEVLLDALRSLSRSEVITRREQRARGLTRDQYGLAEPRIRISLEQGGTPLTILVGRDAPLGGGLYLAQQGRDEIIVAETNLLAALPRSATDLRDRRLFQGVPGDATRLDLKRADGFVQLAKSAAGEWTIQRPVKGRAAAAAVQDMLDRLFDERVLEFVADSSAAASLYGLDEPVAQVTTAGGPSAGEQTLALGQAPAGDTNQIYATIAGSGAIYTVGKALLESLRVPLADFRDRRLLSLPAFEIACVQIDRGEKSIKLQTTNQVDWTVVEPRQYPAEASRVRLLLSAWTGARIEAFHDEYETNLDAIGLSPPGAVVTFARQAPAPAGNGAGEEVLLVSSRAATNGLVLVKPAQEKTLCAIPAAVPEGLETDPLWYRDPTMLAVDSAEVRVLQRQIGDERQSVQREGTNDFRAVDASAEADVEAVRGLLAELRGMRAERLIEEDPKELSRYGLRTPDHTLMVGLSGAEGIGKTLLFGADTSSNLVYAMVKGQDIVFTVEKAVRDKLLAPLYKKPTAEQSGHADGESTTREPAP